MKAVLSITIFAASALGLVVGGRSLDRDAVEDEIANTMAHSLGLDAGAPSLERQYDYYDCETCTSASDAYDAINGATQSCGTTDQVRLPSKDAVQIHM